MAYKALRINLIDANSGKNLIKIKKKNRMTAFVSCVFITRKKNQKKKRTQNTSAHTAATSM